MMSRTVVVLGLMQPLKILAPTVGAALLMWGCSSLTPRAQPGLPSEL
jgi:hypothetical protein